MTAADRRRRPESAAVRARRLESLMQQYSFLRAPIREPSVETVLWGLTEPGRFCVPLRIVDGRTVGLAETYELRRRACILRAWLCARAMHKAEHPAWRRDWRRRLVEQLAEARSWRRAAERARREESSR